MNFATSISFSFSASYVGAFKLAAVSSANVIVNAFSGVDLGRSFIYIKNNRGPKIEPCGTPIFPRRQKYGKTINKKISRY